MAPNTHLRLVAPITEKQTVAPDMARRRPNAELRSREHALLQFYSISSVIIRGSPVTILGFIDRLTSIDLPISMSYLYSRRGNPSVER